MKQVRPVVLGPVEGFEDRFQIVAAEVGHQRGQRIVVVTVEQRADARVAAEVALEMARARPHRP